jgi:hypothetical protein
MYQNKPNSINLIDCPNVPYCSLCFCRRNVMSRWRLDSPNRSNWIKMLRWNKMGTFTNHSQPVLLYFGSNASQWRFNSYPSRTISNKKTMVPWKLGIEWDIYTAWVLYKNSLYKNLRRSIPRRATYLKIRIWGTLDLKLSDSSPALGLYDIYIYICIYIYVHTHTLT